MALTQDHEATLAMDAGWPTVCVVIPTRGRETLVRQAVESVVRQDYRGDLDILVVHDHEEPQHELTRLAVPGRRVTVLTNTHTEGLAGSRNTGLDRTSADFVASCDDDDFWDPEKLRLQMARMVADPDLVVVGAGIRLLMTESRTVEWPGDRAVVSREALLRSRRKELHSSTMLMRRDLFDRVGGYDEQLPGSYGEDYEFLLRAAADGKIGVVNTPLASIRKYTPSWFRERAKVIVAALTYILRVHPEIAESRAGYARLLGTIAFAHATMGERRTAYALAGKALARWPFAPFGWLTIIQASTRIDPLRLLSMTRRLGRGIT
ncbi:MAG TPA: glycosyltransferase family A protein [Nocardioidaceae bacterium]|nr:glycosyltransferase family A protein [Nocardioidaceae bacterium]